jgi:hypothetical protein
MGVTSVTGSHTRDRKRETQRDVHGVTIGSEADFATHESFKGTQQGVVSGPPRTPNAKGSLARIHITRTTGAVAVATVDT